MAIQVSGTLMAALQKDTNMFHGLMYERYPDQYTEIFTPEISEKNFEFDVQLAGYEIGTTMDEGDSVKYSTVQQGYRSLYNHVSYGRGFAISERAILTNQYPELIEQQVTALAFAMKSVKETVAANILNNANNGSVLGGDGVSLQSTAHPLIKGGTFANCASSDSNLSEFAIEQALITIAGFVSDDGNKMYAQGQKLLIPKELQFEAERILKSTLQYNTANNALNAIRNMGKLPEGIAVNQYLSNAKSWFVLTNVPKALRHFVLKPLTFDSDIDFGTNNILHKYTEIYSFFWSDARGVYCSFGQ